LTQGLGEKLGGMGVIKAGDGKMVRRKNEVSGQNQKIQRGNGAKWETL